MQRSCIKTGIMSLRHLKMGFFHLMMDFKKKKELDMSDKALPDWVKVSEKKI